MCTETSNRTTMEIFFQNLILCGHFTLCFPSASLHCAPGGGHECAGVPGTYNIIPTMLHLLTLPLLQTHPLPHSLSLHAGATREREREQQGLKLAKEMAKDEEEEDF